VGWGRYNIHLEARGVLTNPHWPWTGLVALIGFVVIFNGVSALALAYLNRKHSHFQHSIIIFFCNSLLLKLN
jgi:uncharacterized membrane protein HdeD (DUF308 family)